MMILWPARRNRNELKYFNRMTTKLSNPEKMNAVIMGRNTYFGIPPSHRPLPARLNIVLSTTSSAADYPSDVLLCNSLAAAVDRLNANDLADKIESIWIVGGASVYKEAMESPMFHRLYFTEILADYECDTFFPTIPSTFKQITDQANDADTPTEVQEENGIKYLYKIYEKA